MIFSRHIVHFIAVVKYGSYAEAAEQVSLTPSALSHGISELEAKIGVKLLTRKKSGVELTPLGRQFYEEVAPLIQQGREIVQRTRSQAKESANRIRIKIAGSCYPGVMVLTDKIIRQLGKEVTIINIASDNISEDIESGDYDIVIDSCFGYHPPPSEKLLRLPLVSERIGFFIRADIFDKYSTVQQLLAHEALYLPHSALDHSVFQSVIKKLASDNFSVNARGVPGLSDSILAVLAGTGGTLLPERAVDDPLFLTQPITFIKKPFPFDCFLNRVFFFKKERHDELIDIVTLIKQSISGYPFYSA